MYRDKNKEKNEITELPGGNHTLLQRSAVCPPAPRAPTPAGEPLPGRKPPVDEPPCTTTNTNITSVCG